MLRCLASTCSLGSLSLAELQSPQERATLQTNVCQQVSVIITNASFDGVFHSSMSTGPVRS